MKKELTENCGTKLYKEMAQGDPGFDTPAQIADTLLKAFNLNTPSKTLMPLENRKANDAVYAVMREAFTLPRPSEAPAIQMDHHVFTVPGPPGQDGVVTAMKTSLDPDAIQSLLGATVPATPEIKPEIAMIRDIIYQINLSHLKMSVAKSIMAANFLFILWSRESGYDWSAISEDGDARGIGQFRVSTWNGLTPEILAMQQSLTRNKLILRMMKKVPQQPGFHSSLDEVTLWSRPAQYNANMMEADLLAKQNISPKQNCQAKMHPLKQIIAMAINIKKCIVAAEAKWQWSADKQMWMPTSDDTALEFFAIYPPAMYDYVSGFYMIHKVPYGDGAGFMSRSWLLKNKANKLSSSQKFLNHVYLPNGRDRYALAAKDALNYLKSDLFTTIQL